METYFRILESDTSGSHIATGPHFAASRSYRETSRSLIQASVASFRLLIKLWRT